MAKTKDVLAAITPSPKLLAALLNLTQRQGKVEAPKKEEKKFRDPLPFYGKPGAVRRCALPGEARKISDSDSFKKLCAAAKIPATRRQAAKYIQHRGVAYKFEKRNPGWRD